MKGGRLLEVARAELPAGYYAKAMPVLTQRVYRLAKLPNEPASRTLGVVSAPAGEDMTSAVVPRQRPDRCAGGIPDLFGPGSGKR